LVPARDPAALAQAILKLLRQPELRYRFGRLSRQRAVERFDLSLIADQTRKHYRDLLARKTPWRRRTAARFGSCLHEVLRNV
jgi:glycosyltransferase involved in cell wall biosynthesis